MMSLFRFTNSSLLVLRRVNCQSISFQAKPQFSTTRQVLFKRVKSIRDRLDGRVGETNKSVFADAGSVTGASSGKVAIAVGSGLALCGLCYYGMASKEYGASALDRASSIWPGYVRERVHATYGYFGSGLVLTAGSAMAAFRSPSIMKVAARGGWATAIGGMVLLIGTSMLTMSLPYPDDGSIGLKHGAWLLHNAVMGAVLAPICILGGPLVQRAALYTAGIVGGLSAIAATAPSDKFLSMGGPLAMGFGVVLVSSLGSMFLSPASSLGLGLYSISLYGGLLVFGGFLLYDTQKIIRQAETVPPPQSSLMYRQEQRLPGFMPVFDPINASLGIYMDTMNIFIRMVAILSGNRKR